MISAIIFTILVFQLAYTILDNVFGSAFSDAFASGFWPILFYHGEKIYEKIYWKTFGWEKYLWKPFRERILKEKEKNLETAAIPYTEVNFKNRNEWTNGGEKTEKQFEKQAKKCGAYVSEFGEEFFHICFGKRPKIMLKIDNTPSVPDGEYRIE